MLVKSSDHLPKNWKTDASSNWRLSPHPPFFLRLWKFGPVVNTENVDRDSGDHWVGFLVVFCHGISTLQSPPLDHPGPSQDCWVAIADFLQDMMFRRDHIVVLRQSLGRFFAKFGRMMSSICERWLETSFSWLWDPFIIPPDVIGAVELHSSNWKPIGKNLPPGTFMNFTPCVMDSWNWQIKQMMCFHDILCQITKGFYLVSSNLAG